VEKVKRFFSRLYTARVLAPNGSPMELAECIGPTTRNRAKMVKRFFSHSYTALVPSPNSTPIWWHCMPLPDGSRVDAKPIDKSLQHKIWEGMGISANDLKGKSVLDIGANDGFFSIAAALCGASHVVALNTTDWSTWPKNIEYAAKIWDVEIEIVTADFRTWLPQSFEFVFFLGVLYHLEDVFTAMSLLNKFLVKAGTLYLETALTSASSDLPIFEYASDIYPTSIPQGRSTLKLTGISNFLVPNDAAIRNLADTYGFDVVALLNTDYCRENPNRGLYKFIKR
jgi:tRNA (mo5U34)-methyltransferase